MHGGRFSKTTKVAKKWLSSRLTGLVLIVLGISMFIGAYAISHRNSLPPVAPANHDTPAVAPSAVKPTKQAVTAYNVPPTLPKYITIPTIGVAQTRIIQLGLTKNNQIATPDNINDTGWYKNSALPGNSGAMFIYGHVSNWTANGVFYNLKKLRAGNTITITRGDNKTYTYQVVSSKIYPYNAVDMNAVLAPIDHAKPGLNLMTCTGSVIKGTSEFNERLVVFTKLVS